MKKIIVFMLAFLMLATFCSCGEKVECDYCDKEYKKSQSQTKVYDGDTLEVCRDCANLIQDYVDGKVVECLYCGDLVRKKDAHESTVWGETDYVCNKCYEELMEVFN